MAPENLAGRRDAAYRPDRDGIGPVDLVVFGWQCGREYQIMRVLMYSAIPRSDAGGVQVVMASMHRGLKAHGVSVLRVRRTSRTGRGMSASGSRPARTRRDDLR